MLINLISGDTPRSRILALLLLLLLLGLATAPFVFPGSRPLNVAAKICYFTVLAASYDLLLGYTGIVSFAHTMFFGIGAYGVAIASHELGAEWRAIAIGTGGALAASTLLALAIGLFSLRVKAIFFAMITLAIASAFLVLASQLPELTGGEDGRSFTVPQALRPGFRLFDGALFGVVVNGRLITYYLVFLSALALFLLMLRIVNSPFGRVLQAIRENAFRAEALGYRAVLYQTVATALSAAMATLAGVLAALWLRYTGPETTLSFAIMMDILLMVVIGGMGTLYGPALGAALFILAQNYLQNLMGQLSRALERALERIDPGLPLLATLFHPDRWLLWLGILFIVSVYFFPAGIAGRLRRSATLSSFRKMR